RGGNSLLDYDLSCAQHAFIFTVGINNALWFFLCAGRGKDRLHDEARAEDEAIETVEIGLHVFNWARRHARFHRGLGHCGSDAENQALIEWRRNDIVKPESGRIARIGARSDI